MFNIKNMCKVKKLAKYVVILQMKRDADLLALVQSVINP